jgi:hypothetical protein
VLGTGRERRIKVHLVRTERRGNDNVTVIMRPSGDRIATTVDENGFLLRRSRILPDGREIIIIDNRPREAGFAAGRGFGGFFVDLPPPVIRIPRERIGHIICDRLIPQPGKPLAEHEIVIDPEFVVRDSTGPVRASG